MLHGVPGANDVMPERRLLPAFKAAAETVVTILSQAPAIQPGTYSLDSDALAEDILLAWSKVRKPGNDQLTVAVEQAKASPLRLSLSRPLTLLVLTALYLQVLRPEGSIYLPRKRVAALLGLEHQEVSRLVQTMEKLDLLRVVDDTYSFTTGKAKSYSFNTLALRPLLRVDGMQSTDGSDGILHTFPTIGPTGSS
jgi:hypothetical protein